MMCFTGRTLTDISASGCSAQELDRKRHLLRLWVAPPVDRPLPECYAELYGTTKVGDRGGILVKGYDLNIKLEAE